MDLGQLAERLQEELPVGPRCGSIPIAPDGEDLQGLRARIRRLLFGQRLRLLAQERREHDDRAEHDQVADLTREKVHQRGVESDASALPEADDHHAFPVEPVLGDPGLDGFGEGARQQLQVVQEVEVLVFEACAIPYVPGAVDHFRRLDVELREGLASGVLRPRRRQQAAVPDGNGQVLEYCGIGLGVVPDENDKVLRLTQVSALERDRDRPLGAHRSNGLGREQEAQPLLLQLVALLLLLALRSLLLLRKEEAFLLFSLLLRRGMHLLLQGGEDKHDLDVIRMVCRAAEGVRNRILADFVQHRVNLELVGTNELRDVLHDRHHLLLVRRQAMHPPRQVEPIDAAAPCGEEAWRDLNRLQGAVADDDNLGVLVA
mmetsp:Transcript_81904/g.236824  ORF Transcript_81904/g.236824 Transcript_81904/m.236824 type:complete len:374 (+) Transcript_81904:339-1460(+)